MTIRSVLALLAALLLAGCEAEPPQALGTLEWDRISLPATASEPILAIAVREGASLHAGDLLMQLDPSRAVARRDTAAAEVARLRGQLAELQVGARSESRDEAAARVQAARARARNAEQQLARTQALVAKRLLPRAQLDQAQATERSARADVNAATAAYDLLRNGSRSEDIVQAQAALEAAEAQLKGAQIDLDRLTVRAPRDGHVDSLPYKVGDQPPSGAVLAVLLVGDSPYARVYVPEPVRASLSVGQTVAVRVEGAETTHQGRVRALRSEASFTPYYALTGQDAARLSYLAEVELGADAVALPVGIPVRVQWSADAPE